MLFTFLHTLQYAISNFAATAQISFLKPLNNGFDWTLEIVKIAGFSTFRLFVESVDYHSNIYSVRIQGLNRVEKKETNARIFHSN